VKYLPLMPTLLLTMILGSATASTDAFPDRPIRLVVPFPPGGSTDLVARIVGAKAGQILGQQVIVDNRAGAGGSIGSAYVAKADPDGYTLLMATTSHTANPSLYQQLPYDTSNDFASISLLCDMPGLLVAHPSVPANDLVEFVHYAKAQKLDYGSAGIGTFPHLSMAMLIDRADLEMTHIPYKGAAPALKDLVGGVYQAKVDAYITANDFVQDGKLKLYAVTSAQRMAKLPDVPTVAELGYPGFESTYWIGIVVPSATPAPIREKLEKAFREAIHDKDVSARLEATGTRPIGSSAADLDQRIQLELNQWPAILQKSGIGGS